MKQHIRNVVGQRDAMARVWLLVLGLMAASFMTQGCTDTHFDREPPEGQGTLYVDNRTSGTLQIFVNGESVDRVRGRRYRYFDLDPGVYRVALDDVDVRRSYAGDVDILLGRRTILDVTTDPADMRRLSVLSYFE